MPFRPLVLLTALLHTYLALRLAPAWPLPGAVALALLLAASAALIPFGFIAGRMAPGRLATVLTWAGLLAMGLFSTTFVLALLRDGLLAVGWIANQAGATLPLAAWSQDSGRAVPLLALAASAVGFRNARRTARVVRVDVPIAGLPAALDGFAIAQLSDVHVGPTIGQRTLQAIVDRVNTLGADAVAITGDLVDGPAATVAPALAPLAGLRSRHGTFFVTGNHEYYVGVQPWLPVLERLGVRTLMNAHAVLRHGGAELVLAGVADYTAGHFEPAHASDAARALAGAPATAGARVLLAHQPRSAPAAAAAGFDLQLSGHTHGGQFWPWGYFVPLQQPFVAGLKRLGRMWVYVSRGTGYWGPPKRFGAPSEITLLRLAMADRPGSTRRTRPPPGT